MSYNSRPMMSHSDSATYRQYTQALEEEQKQQALHNTMPNGTLLPNGFARGATPTNTMLQNDAMALRSVYEKEEEHENPIEQQQQVYTPVENQYQYNQVPTQSQAPTPLIDQANLPPEQVPEPKPIVQIVTSEARDYQKLWKWAYKEACKQRGITVRFKILI